MPISTNGVIVTRLAGALYNQQLSNATYNEVLSAFNSPAALNTLANYLISTDFASKTDLQIANTIVTNLGLSSVAGVANWVSAQLTAAGSAGKGAKIISLLNDFANIDATDVTYGALASAFNSKIDAAQGLSQTTGNTGTTFAAAGTAGKSFPLTTGVDVFTGGTGDDSFSAVIANVGGANSTGTTMQAGDVLNGGTGTDTLSVSVTGGTVGSTSAVTFTGIEKISVSNVNGAFAQTISLALADSSLTTVGNSSSNTGAVTTFTGLSKIVASEMSNGDGSLTTTYNTSVVAGTADVASLTLSNQTTGGTFTATGIETLNVASTTSANAVTLAAGPTTVNVSGTARLTLGQLDTGITTLNASTNSGGLVATLSSTATAVITGSSGNDTITAGTNMSGAGAVNAGDGVDTLVSTADALIATAADGARFTNFETLSISTSALVNGASTRTQNMSQISGITTVNVTAARADGTANNATHGVTISNIPATLNTLNVTGLVNADTTIGTDGLDVTVTATRAINTAADATTVNLGTSTATVGTTGTATNGAAAGAITLALSLANEESITINSLGGASGTNFLAGITNGSATAVTATGARALSFASMSSTVVKTIDASAMTGAFIMGTNAGAVTSTITGGSGADTLTGGSAADNIIGGAGNDSISGAAGADVITGDAGNDTLVGGSGIDNLSGGDGNDTFSVTTAADFTGLTTPETVSGGAGNDNLSFAETNNAITVSAADLLGINSIETITINGGNAAGSITLTDAVYTANGATTLAIVDGNLATGTLSVNASALTAANSVVITPNTSTASDSLVGGAGADTFKFSTTTGLETGDTVTGGAGTDTIELSAASAAVTAVMTNVTTVERIVTVGSGGNVIINGLVDAVISTTGTLTTDASSLTNGTASLAYDGSGVSTTATKVQNVTGGSGDDTISGGIGNDIIVGGDGNDSIVGGTGIDNLSGGNGNDTFAVATVAHFVGLNSVETVSGGAGNDILLFNVGANALTVNAADLLGLSSVETITVVSGNATAAVTLSDAVFTANGLTAIALGSDATSTEVVQLNASGVGSANSVAFTAGRAAAKSDSLVGGSGNDSFTFNTTTSGDALAAGDIVNGGAGNDLLTITIPTTTNALTAVTLTNVSNIERLTVSGADLNAGTITLVNANFATVTGAAITASSLTTGTFSLDASAEVESTFSITGGGGADTIIGGQVADTISGGAGADVITGGLGADSLTGGVGADTFVYATVAQSNGTATDTITDFVTGTDKLQVTLNYSTLVTSLDINAVRSSAGVAGSSAAQDTLSGQRGQYVYDTTGSSLFINFNADNLLTTADYKININPASTASASIVDGDVNFVITGGTAGDVIIAGGGADNIDGAAGDDNITGGAGNDTIAGGTGADTIRGGTGADAITPGAGNDQVIVVASETSAITSTALATPGTLSGTEAFTWSTASGWDTITGFADGDTLQLYTTGTTAITTSGVVVVAGGTIPSATTGAFAGIRGTQTSSTVFTASTTGADTLLLWDADGTGTGATYAAVVLVGYTTIANDTVSAAGLFTAVA